MTVSLIPTNRHHRLTAIITPPPRRMPTALVASSAFAALRERALPRRSPVGRTRRPRRRRRRVTSWRASSDPSSTTPRDAFVPATWRDLHIDWGRRHLQVLFVDADHGVLARSAEGVCARVAIWAGAGHMVFPESAGLDVKAARQSADDAVRLLTRLAPVCDHPRYAARAPYAFTDADAAAADLVVTLGGAAMERDVASAATSAANVIDLWEFAQFADVAEIDGTGAAAILQRSLALEVVAPELPHALSLAPGDPWGMETESVVDESVAEESRARMESRAQASLRLARARVVIGVVGLVTFLIAIAPVEEVERRTKR